jgi:hypothetical protein
MVERQSFRNQTLYADLLQEAVADTLPAGVGMSFTHKTINDRRYWYLSVAIGKRRIQTYLGPDSDELREQIKLHREKWSQAEKPLRARALLVAHLIKSGATPTPPGVASILSLLADGGVFLAGGVVIGSIAFAAYANMLGVQWTHGSMQTQDIDIATDHVAVAVQPDGILLEEVLAKSDLKFTPIPALTPKAPNTGFSSGPGGIHVDVLTPMRGKESSRPIFLKRLGVYAEPLRFLDYLLEDSQQCVLLAKSGILVHVPNPARYALHKLVVAERRPTTWATKARKDIDQAAQIIQVLVEDRPGELISALEAAKNYHQKFYQTLEKGMERLPGLQNISLSELMELVS